MRPFAPDAAPGVVEGVDDHAKGRESGPFDVGRLGVDEGHHRLGNATGPSIATIAAPRVGNVGFNNADAPSHDANAGRSSPSKCVPPRAKTQYVMSTSCRMRKGFT